MSSPALVAVCQMTSTNDVEKNFEVVDALLGEAKARGARLAVLPECFAFMGAADGEVLKVMAPLDGEWFGRFRALARLHGLWACFGGFPERADDAHAYNAHVVIDDTGAVRAVYRKIHLFDVQLKNGTSYKESACTAPGRELVVTDSPAGPLGLSICYDLRFPELYRALALRGAKLLLVPAAFTLTTGKEHWEALLRARAIENECYVLAAAQTGRHNDRRETFGHAMVIDPWGTVIAQCKDGTGVALAEIDLGFLDDVRERIPVWSHRRADVF